MLGGAELTALAMLVVAAVWTVVYQVGPGGGYYATIVYLGDDSTRALLIAVGNTVRARAARHRHAARVASRPAPATPRRHRRWEEPPPFPVCARAAQVRYAAELTCSLSLYSLVAAFGLVPTLVALGAVSLVCALLLGCLLPEMGGGASATSMH